MADVAVPATPTKLAKAPKAPKTPKAAKVVKPKAPKAPAAHPKFLDMIKAAVAALKERNGSSRQALVKYVMANYKVGTDQKAVNTRIKVTG
jgi:histone H1/5